MEMPLRSKLLEPCRGTNSSSFLCVSGVLQKTLIVREFSTSVCLIAVTGMDVLPHCGLSMVSHAEIELKSQRHRLVKGCSSLQV